MEQFQLDGGDLPVDVRVSRFRTPGGAVEQHLIAQPTRDANFATQLGWLEQACRSILPAHGCGDETLVFRRLFCSDLANQSRLLGDSSLTGAGAVSLVGQAPATPARIAMWSYHVVDPAGPVRIARDARTTSLSRGPLTHHFTTRLGMNTADPSAPQTTRIFSEYEQWLRSRGMTVANHVLRTWLFVRDIDVNYRGMVEARREVFDRCGLNAGTHYLASSGIEASPGTPASVVMDAYAIEGVDPGQISYPRALAQMSPTNVYGVTFERAAAVTFGDRRHVIVSGTASIDARGNILHEGDVQKQLDRTLENIGALLKEADATLSDMAYYIVYLRDPADVPIVRARLADRVSPAPMVFVTAKVCRPGWLVEIEGHAIVPASHPAWAQF